MAICQAFLHVVADSLRSGTTLCEALLIWLGGLDGEVRACAVRTSSSGRLRSTATPRQATVPCYCAMLLCHAVRARLAGHTTSTVVAVRGRQTDRQTDRQAVPRAPPLTGLRVSFTMWWPMYVTTRTYGRSTLP